MAWVTLFPHGRIREQHLKNLCSLFHTVHIAMPWAMEPTKVMQKAVGFGLLEIHRPPVSQRFDTELKAIVKDYENLANWYKEGKLSSFLRAAARNDQGEARWEISEAIKKSCTLDNIQPDLRPLYHQILLHLYQKTEENLRKAETDLDALDISGSPLAQALGQEGTVERISKSSSKVAIKIPLSDSLIEQITRAWIELFQDVLHGTRILVTLSPEVFSYATSLVEEHINSSIVSAQQLQITRLTFPSCADVSWEKFNNEQIYDLKEKIWNLISSIFEAPSDIVPHHLAQNNLQIGQSLGELFCLGEVDNYQLTVCPLPHVRIKDEVRQSLAGKLSNRLMIGLGI